MPDIMTTLAAMLKINDGFLYIGILMVFAPCSTELKSFLPAISSLSGSGRLKFIFIFFIFVESVF